MNRHEFYQWDSDVTVPIEDTPQEVHLASVGTSHAYVVTPSNGTFPIPNILLQKPKDILAWYVTDDRAIREVHITVHRRAKPDTYVYTPTEVKTVESMSQEVLDALSKLEEYTNANGIDSVQVSMLASDATPTATLAGKVLSLGIPEGKGSDVNLSSANDNLVISKTTDGFQLEVKGTQLDADTIQKVLKPGDNVSLNRSGGEVYVAVPGPKVNPINKTIDLSASSPNKFGSTTQRSVSIGRYNTVASNESVARGQSCQVMGSVTTATGVSNIAVGAGSRADGYGTISVGKQSVATGRYNELDGFTMWKSGTEYKVGDTVGLTTSGLGSTTFHGVEYPEQNYICRDGFHLFQCTKAHTASSSFATDKDCWSIWCVDNFDGRFQYQVGRYALVVGNGTSDSERSNALSLDWDGNLTVAGKVNGVDLSQVGGGGESAGITTIGTGGVSGGTVGATMTKDVPKEQSHRLYVLSDQSYIVVGTGEHTSTSADDSYTYLNLQPSASAKAVLDSGITKDTVATKAYVDEQLGVIANGSY